MIREIYMSIIFAFAAGIAVYGLFSVPYSVLDRSLTGLLFSIGLFVAGLHFLKCVSN